MQTDKVDMMYIMYLRTNSLWNRRKSKEIEGRIFLAQSYPSTRFARSGLTLLFLLKLNKVSFLWYYFFMLKFAHAKREYKIEHPEESRALARNDEG